MNKVLKYMAAAIFIATLAINVVVTLDDPFVMLSDDAIATTSASCNGTNAIYCYNGGCGAASCSIESGIEILKVGVSVGGSVSTNNPAYFACCSIHCRTYLNSDYKVTDNVLDTDI